jgi:hypothetical protein
VLCLVFREVTCKLLSLEPAFKLSTLLVMIKERAHAVSLGVLMQRLDPLPIPHELCMELVLGLLISGDVIIPLIDPILLPPDELPNLAGWIPQCLSNSLVCLVPIIRQHFRVPSEIHLCQLLVFL